MRRRVLIAAACLALASCERAAAPSHQAAGGEAFRHALSEDVSGEYRPVAPVQIDGLALESVFIGQPSALEAWEQGRGGSAPVIVSLRTREGVIRVGPEAYQVTDEAIRFRGLGGRGVTVTLTGRLDQGALATARRNLGDQTPVIQGALSIGGQSAPVRLTLWGGD